MGYLLVGLVAGGPAGISSVYFYGWVYLFMNLGAFAIVICLSNALQSNDLSSYNGLAKRSPLLSALFVLFLVSLAGLPPTAGFIVKFYVLSAAYNAGWVWLVLLASVNSVISVGYYFKILRVMYFKAPTSEDPIQVNLSTRLTLGVTSFVTLFLGIAPQIGFLKMDMLANRSVSEPVAALSAPVAPVPFTPPADSAVKP